MKKRIGMVLLACIIFVVTGCWQSEWNRLIRNVKRDISICNNWYVPNDSTLVIIPDCCHEYNYNSRHIAAVMGVEFKYFSSVGTGILKEFYAGPDYIYLQEKDKFITFGRKKGTISDTLLIFLSEKKNYEKYGFIEKKLRIKKIPVPRNHR